MSSCPSWPCLRIAPLRSGCRRSRVRSRISSCGAPSTAGAPLRLLAILNEVTEVQEPNRVENVIIIGSGPAGFTAALYAARANLNPLVIEGFAWGGLLQQTTDVENYPGFPEGIMGPEMMQRFRDQAERFGAKLLTDDVTRIELGSEPGGVHSVWVGGDEHRARTVVLAMGAEHKKLCVPGEQELGGRGIRYCPRC